MKTPKYDSRLGWNEEAEQSWRHFLSHFQEHIFPMFQEINISLDTALTCWEMNRLRQTIIGASSEKEHWKE